MEHIGQMSLYSNAKIDGSNVKTGLLTAFDGGRVRTQKELQHWIYRCYFIHAEPTYLVTEWNTDRLTLSMIIIILILVQYAVSSLNLQLIRVMKHV